MELARIILPCLTLFWSAIIVQLLATKLIKKENSLLPFFSLTVGPLFLGLLLYLLFFVFPEHSNFFYLTTIYSILILASIFLYKNIFTLFSQIAKSFSKLWSSDKRDFLFYFLLAVIVLIVAAVFTRTLLWPPLWDDQILYINQAYAIAHSHSIIGFMQSSMFRDHNMTLSSNPNIRPGLPMIYSFFDLFTKCFKSIQLTASIVVFYYFLVLLGLIPTIIAKYFTKNKLKTGLLALFFTLTSFYFIDHTICGFKEIIFCSAILLGIDFILEIKNSKEKLLNLIMLSIVLGSMAFINYSGTIIFFIFLIILFIATSKIKLAKRLINLLILTISGLIFSGFEFFTLFSWMFSKSITTPVVQSSAPAKTDVFSTLAVHGGNEFAGYNITGIIDLYIKGKFQGFTQPQFFGLVFILFLIVLIFTFRKTIKNEFNKYLLIFLGLYSFIVFDPLSLNRHPYAYVLAISHKYTVLLIPFIAIIIASNFDWLEKISDWIKPRAVAIVLSILALLDFIYLRNHINLVLDLIKKVIPIYYADSYYLNLLTLGNNLMMMALVVVTLVIFLLILIKGNTKLVELWQKEKISLILLLTFFFLAPLVFFFNTNYGITDTISYSFSSTNQKLLHVKGRNVFPLIGEVQNLNPSGNVLLIGEPKVFFQLNFPIDKLVAGDEIDPKEFNIDLLKTGQIEYIVAKADSKIGDISLDQIKSLQLEKVIGQDVLYKNLSF